MLFTMNVVFFIFFQVEVEIAKPAETPFPAPLEEGIPYEMYTQFLAPPEPEEENTMVCFFFT